jgi:hypothetical protein
MLKRVEPNGYIVEDAQPRARGYRLLGSILRRKRSSHISRCGLVFGLLFLASLYPRLCRAQLCATTHSTDLYCLLPAAFHTQAAPFNAIFTPFGNELSELPTARPAGLVLTFNKGLLVPANESLGAVFTERAESLGKHRIFVGFTYQNFGFGSVDGVRLRNIPIVLFFAPLDVYTATRNRFDIRVGQYTAVAALGVTSRLDLSVAIPFERVAFKASVNGMEYGPGGATAGVNEYVPGSSRGLADVVIGAKASIAEWKNFRLAGGLDFRIPSGDELNFLGSGTYGVRPYLGISRKGKVSPHGNAGYQWNGQSILNANSSGGKQQLPTNFFYNAGVNVEATRHLTLVADLLGRHFYSAPRLASPTSIVIPNAGSAPSVQPETGSYTTNDLGVGFKTQSFAHLIITGNVTFKLNDAGLRAKVIPLGGLSYSF